MRAFLNWLAGTLFAFGLFAGGAHALLSAAPSPVLVVVDASFPMAAAWSRVPAALDRIDDAPYARFALRSHRASIHDWDDGLDLGRARAYGPRDLSGVAELCDAPGRRVLITTAPAAEIPDACAWEIVRP